MKRVSDQEAEALIARTEELETAKALRQNEREQRKHAREQKNKRAFQEKLVAPILLIVTLLISALLVMLY